LFRHFPRLFPTEPPSSRLARWVFLARRALGCRRAPAPSRRARPWGKPAHPAATVTEGTGAVALRLWNPSRKLRAWPRDEACPARKTPLHHRRRLDRRRRVVPDLRRGAHHVDVLLQPRRVSL